MPSSYPKGLDAGHQQVVSSEGALLPPSLQAVHVLGGWSKVVLCRALMGLCKGKVQQLLRLLLTMQLGILAAAPVQSSRMSRECQQRAAALALQPSCGQLLLRPEPAS